MDSEPVAVGVWLARSCLLFLLSLVAGCEVLSPAAPGSLPSRPPQTSQPLNPACRDGTALRQGQATPPSIPPQDRPGLSLAREESESSSAQETAQPPGEGLPRGKTTLQQVVSQTRDTPETEPLPAPKGDTLKSGSPVPGHCAERSPESGPQPITSFAALSELPIDALIREVLARNPTLAQMTAAWRAASARYPQVTSLDDPMFGGTIGPASIGSNEVDFAYRVEISQRYPFPGKLKLRGDNARAEAS